MISLISVPSVCASITIWLIACVRNDNTPEIMSPAIWIAEAIPSTIMLRADNAMPKAPLCSPASEKPVTNPTK